MSALGQDAMLESIKGICREGFGNLAGKSRAIDHEFIIRVQQLHCPSPNFVLSHANGADCGKHGTRSNCNTNRSAIEKILKRRPICRDCGGSAGADQSCGLRATGGAVKLVARPSSKSHRICQILPSTKPTAIATEISKALSRNKVIGVSSQPNAIRAKRGEMGRAAQPRRYLGLGA